MRTKKTKTLSEHGDSSVFGFFGLHIRTLESQGRYNTAAHFRTVYGNFKRFRGGTDLAFDEMDENLCRAYEQWLRARGLCRNSSSMYLRCLRVIFNLAVERGLTENRKLFVRLFTGNEHTVKRALTSEEIRKIKGLDLSGLPSLEFSRDIFLFSLYCRGMSLVDMAKLRRSDLRGAELSYGRAKTGRQLTMDWVSEMQEIVKKHTVPNSPYLLPLQSDTRSSTWRPSHKSIGQSVNRHLRKVGVLAGVDKPFTLYSARHTWATLARDNGCSIFVIMEGMGHDSIRTTQIYLSELDANLVDEANYKIIRSLD